MSATGKNKKIKSTDPKKVSNREIITLKYIHAVFFFSQSMHINYIHVILAIIYMTNKSGPILIAVQVGGEEKKQKQKEQPPLSFKVSFKCRTGLICPTWGISLRFFCKGCQLSSTPLETSATRPDRQDFDFSASLPDSGKILPLFSREICVGRRWVAIS